MVAAAEQIRDAPVFFVRVSPRGKKGETAQRIDLIEKVISFKFTDDEKKADILSLAIDNFDLKQLDSGVWKKGQVLEFSWGYINRMAPTRTAVIKKITGLKVLTIEAHAESVLMDTEVRCRLFENKKRSEVIEEIAKENGFTGIRVDIEDTEVTHDAVTQARLTDAQFIRHLANKEGFEFYVDFSGFHFHKRRLEQPAVKTLTYYNDERQGDIEDLALDNDISKRPGKVTRKGRDLRKKKDIEGVGSNETAKDEPTLGDYVEVIDAETGEKDGTSAINTVNDEVAPTSETSDAAAEKVAKGRYRKSRAATIQMTVKMAGDPDMLAKIVFNLKIASQRLQGKYYVSQATHTIAGSYRTELKIRRDASSSNVGLIGDEGIKAEGKKNNAPERDANEIVIREEIDPVTGQEQIKFVDNRGKR